MLKDEHPLGEYFFKKTGSAEKEDDLPNFPEEAWRGIFDDYRKANARATEASDVFHFGSFWARGAATLGRRVHFPYGMNLYPNVYVVCFGPTGDRKTTATRRAANELGNGIKVISGGGSGEGLADAFSKIATDEGALIHTEELSQILRPGRWEGSTLLPFMTQCFDCPDRYEMNFRKSGVALERPTPNLLAGVTPEWFWRDFRAVDFQGGFGNRLFFLTGSPKGCITQPEAPELASIIRGIEELARIEPCVARLDERAGELWDRFYKAWHDAEMKSGRDSLFLVAVKRIPAYVLKLAMFYAASEGTLPKIHADQLSAAILVGRYSAECAKELLSLQHTGTSPRKALERCILAYASRGTATKREVYKSLWRHYPDAEAFNRAFDSLQRAGEIFTRHAGRGSILVSTEPLVD